VAQFAPESLAQFAPDLVAQFDRNIHITKGLSRETVNIIIYKKNEVLTNLFITENKIHNDIDKI
jgi:hypothetical protein